MRFLGHEPRIVNKRPWKPRPETQCPPWTRYQPGSFWRRWRRTWGRLRAGIRSPPWYDKLVGDEGSDYHRNVILPAALKLLDLKAGERVLDLCCGQGILTRSLMEFKPRRSLVRMPAPS